MKIIKDVNHVLKPLCFLCGPYYDDKPYDRRKILRDFLIEVHNVLPIIVDKFLDKKNISDTSINIDLIEEICAAVSVKTYIFLDTFSSVAELGIFASKAHSNEIDVFIPKNTDIISNNIGYFIGEIIHNTNNNKVNCFNYRPKIVRVPLASDYVTEFYEFTNNELPQYIQNYIKNDMVLKTNKHTLSFRNGSLDIEENGTIIYQYNSDLCFTVSLRMLFYLVASILLPDKNKKVCEIVSELKELLKNSFRFYENQNPSNNIDVKIKTRLTFDIDIIVRHILVFIDLYYSHGDPKGRHILIKEDSFLCELDSFMFFGITSQQQNLIQEYIANPDSFLEVIKIKRGKKTRNVTKYRNDDNGNCLRVLHQSILNKLLKIYAFSDLSYAYRKGYSILDCARLHKNSTSFLKIDIKKFFNSIGFMSLYNCSKNLLRPFFVLDRELLKVCMYKNTLPLGLITSPILSDIYLNEFDTSVSNKLNEYDKKIIFTRYADDMFFSSEIELDSNDIDFLTNLVRKELDKLDLQINEDKLVSKNLKFVGDHFKILGLNIVKTQEENEITVGKKYIYDTCKMYLQYLKNKNNENISKETLFYTDKRIAGRTAFIKQIEGANGLKKLEKRIEISASCSSMNTDLESFIQRDRQEMDPTG